MTTHDNSKQPSNLAALNQDLEEMIEFLEPKIAQERKWTQEVSDISDQITRLEEERDAKMEHLDEFRKKIMQTLGHAVYPIVVHEINMSRNSALDEYQFRGYLNNMVSERCKEILSELTYRGNGNIFDM